MPASLAMLVTARNEAADIADTVTALREPTGLEHRFARRRTEGGRVTSRPFR